MIIIIGGVHFVYLIVCRVHCSQYFSQKKVNKDLQGVDGCRSLIIIYSYHTCIELHNSFVGLCLRPFLIWNTDNKHIMRCTFSLPFGDRLLISAENHLVFPGNKKQHSLGHPTLSRLQNILLPMMPLFLTQLSISD